MASSRFPWLALFLAGSLAGCAGLRGQSALGIATTSATPAKKSGPATARTESQKPTEKSPRREAPIALTSNEPPPPFYPALYIPGKAPPKTLAPKIQDVPLPPASEPVTPTETVLPPLRPSAAVVSDQPLHALYRKAALKWQSLDSYACTMRRREVVAGRQKPEELVRAQFRKEPFSVHLQWIGAEGKDREVLYVQGQHGNMIHTLTAAGDVPLMPAGARFKVAPDSMLVKNRSRYPITDAGVASLIERFGKLIEALDKNDPRTGAVKYLGQVKRKEFEQKVEVVIHKILPGWESLLPGGGQRLWCFDAEHGLPVLIVTHDEADREVEYACHDRFEFPGPYTDDDFNPDRRWAKSKSNHAAAE